MSSNEFKNRVYGCVVVKATNANYNADFNGLPRRLKSDGSFYATDKSFKWLVRNYIKKNYENEKILFTKYYDENFVDTVDLKKAFEMVTRSRDIKDLKKKDILPKLTECIDVRLFGAVFSPENSKKNDKDENKNISIHGAVQVNHATDLYGEGKVYTDEILAPFTAIGSMSKATEAHYIHNFSINPKNLSSWTKVLENENSIKLLSPNDIAILKNAFNNAATFYDSHSKSGVENELSVYATLKEGSLLTLPNFAQFITFKKGEDGEKNSFDLIKLMSYLKKYETEIDCIEVYAIDELTDVFCGVEEPTDDDKAKGKLNAKYKKCDLLQLSALLEGAKNDSSKS